MKVNFLILSIDRPNKQFFRFDSILIVSTDFTTRAKKKFFKWIRLLPPVRRRIEEEIAKAAADMEKSTAERTKHMQYYTTLPMLGLSKAELLMQIDNYLALGEFEWRDGHVSGAVYSYDTELCSLVGTIYEKTAYTNPLHSDVFPGINKMEAEIVRMCAAMLNGNANTVGTVSNCYSDFHLNAS